MIAEISISNDVGSDGPTKFIGLQKMIEITAIVAK
jgi:hypothetical protein